MKFTIWEKALLHGIVSKIPNSEIGQIKSLLKSMDSLEPTEKEKSIVEKIKDENNKEYSDEDYDREFEVDIDKEDIRVIVDNLNRQDISIKFPVKQRSVDLSEKLDKALKG